MSVSPVSRTTVQGIPPAAGNAPQVASSKLGQTPQHDQVHFGGPKTPQKGKLPAAQETKPPAKPSIKTALTNVVKAIFQPWELVKDFGIGLLLAIATVIIPPHAHALAMIPFSFIFGMGLRSAFAVKNTYWPAKN